jgi:hypothetical protein
MTGSMLRSSGLLAHRALLVRLLRRRSQRKGTSAPSSSARRARDYRRSQARLQELAAGHSEARRSNASDEGGESGVLAARVP